MTMHEQELMLFGGWAKARIPPQIEIGVERFLGTPSVSTSPRWVVKLDRTATVDDTEIEPEIDIVGIVEARRYIITSDQHRPILSLLPPQRETYQTLDPTEKYKHIADSRGADCLVSSEWSAAIYDTFLHTAFTRFFEIWKRGTANDLHRGTAGTAQLMRSFSGMLGGQNTGIAEKGNKKPLTKLENGVWFLNNTSILYPQIRRFPPEGIENARRVARELQKKREK